MNNFKEVNEYFQIIPQQIFITYLLTYYTVSYVQFNLEI